MENNYNNLFTHLEVAEPSSRLLLEIMARIDKEQHSLKIKIRFVLSLLLSVVTAAFLVPVFNSLREAVVQSGFIDFVSLFFSDFGSVVGYWREYGMSLLESVPFLNLIGMLGIVFVLLCALKYFVHDIKYVVSPWIRPSLKH
jgi:hypothetical protein